MAELPAVVLLHGQPGTGGDWQWVTPLLAGRYTVLAPDRPGYGRSSGPATGFAGNAEATLRLMDRDRVDRAVLVGHSWAGGVCLAFAARWPDRLAGLVLVSSVGPGERFGWDDRLLAAPVLGDAMAAATIGGIGLLVRRRRIRSLADRRLDGRVRDAVVSLSRLTGSGSRAWRSFVAEQRALLRELEGLAPGLPSVTVPVAVVHGRSDRLVPPTVAENLAAAIPTARLHLIPGVGHLLPHDRPDAVVAAVDETAGRADGAQTAR